MPTTGMSPDELENHSNLSLVLGAFTNHQSFEQKLDFLISGISTNSDLTKAVVATLANFGNNIKKEVPNVRRTKNYP